jgi:hypothetical protein
MLILPGWGSANRPVLRRWRSDSISCACSQQVFRFATRIMPEAVQQVPNGPSLPSMM